MGTDTANLKSKLETKRSYLLNEVERITKLLEAITEAEHYLEEPGQEVIQSRLILTPPVAEKPGEKPNRERIREALSRMPETFTSMDLWNTANDDGQGPIIARKNFAPYFSRLLKKGNVTQIQAPKGNTPGIYKKGSGGKAAQIINMIQGTSE